MALNQQPSGWTAMSIVPNPDLFARAHNTINAVSNPAAPRTQPVTSSALPAANPLTGYQALQQKLFPNLAQQQIASQQSQATGAPAQAVAAVTKQLESSPWTAQPATQPAPFLNPTTGQATQQKVPAAKTNGWVSPVSSAALPQI